MAFIEIKTERFGDAIMRSKFSLHETTHILKRKRKIVIAPNMIGQITIPLSPRKDKLYLRRGH